MSILYSRTFSISLIFDFLIPLPPCHATLLDLTELNAYMSTLNVVGQLRVGTIASHNSFSRMLYNDIMNINAI